MLCVCVSLLSLSLGVGLQFGQKQKGRQFPPKGKAAKSVHSSCSAHVVLAAARASADRQTRMAPRRAAALVLAALAGYTQVHASLERLTTNV